MIAIDPNTLVRRLNCRFSTNTTHSITETNGKPKR
jgi:hypothetical protein